MNGFSDGREIERLWNSLRSQIVQRGADEHTAEDVVQETWLRALRNPPERDMRGWLFVVAIRFLRQVRSTSRHRKHRELVVSRPDKLDPELVPEPADLLRFVEELSEPYRAVVRLRFLEDRDVDEIASLLDRQPETVRTQLRRGLERLRSRLIVAPDERRERRVDGLIGLAWLRGLFRRRGPGSLPAHSTFAALGAVLGMALWVVGATTMDRDGASAAPAASADREASQHALLSAIPLAEGERSALPTISAHVPSSERVRLAGYVRRPDATVVPGALVFAGPPDATTPSSSTVADENGHYEIETGPRDLVWASHPDECASRRTYVACLEERLTFDLSLSPKRSRLEILVRDCAGAPVADARVMVDPWAGRVHFVSGRGTLDLPPPVSEVRTDAEGRASVVLPSTNLGTEIGQLMTRIPLLVLAPGLPAWSTEVEPVDGGAPLAITLPRPASLRGTCVDEAGQPVWNAHVEVLQIEGFARIETDTGPDGGFVLDGLSPGDFVVRASEDPARGWRSARLEGVVDEGKTGEVQLILDDAHTLRGWVVSGLQAAPGSRVTLEALSPTSSEGRSLRAIRCGEDGRFSFGGCAGGGRYRLRAYPPGSERVSDFRGPILPGVEEFVLCAAETSQEVAPIAVEFLGPAELVPRLIEVRRIIPAVSEQLASENGSFLSSPLPAGNYQVIAWLNGIGPCMAGSVVHDPGFPRAHPFPAPERGSVAVELVLPPGIRPEDAIAGVKLPGFNCYGMGEQGKRTAQREIQWDPARGVYWAELAAGEYNLSARGRGLTATQTEGVRITARAETRVRLTLYTAIEARLVFCSPRAMLPSEVLYLDTSVPGGENRLGFTALALRRIEGGFELSTWLPVSTTELAVSTRLLSKEDYETPTRLEGRRTLEGGELVQGDPLPSIAVQLVELPD